MSHPNRYLRNITPGELITAGESITGTGSIESAVNAFCFVGAYSDGNCRMCIPPNAEVYIGYDSIVYKYFGPSEVCIGSGGAGGTYPHYITTAADWVPTGTTSHTALDGRSDIDSHPQSAITGLDSRLLILESRADETDTEQATQDTELARLEQVKLDIADALVIFSFAAYGTLKCPVNSLFPDIDATYQPIDILTTSPYTPRGLTLNTTTSTIAFLYDGIYKLTVSGALSHTETNAGRETYIRLYNITKDTPGVELLLITGRNQPGTPISADAQFEITDAIKGDVFRLEIGGGDAYSTVVFQTLAVNITAVSEWREPV